GRFPRTRDTRARRRLRAAEQGERAQRHAGEAALLARVGELALEQAVDAPPHELGAGDAPRRARPAVERLLQLPRRAVERSERLVDRSLVGHEARLTAGEEVEDRVGREPRGDEALVHAVAGDAID